MGKLQHDNGKRRVTIPAPQAGTSVETPYGWLVVWASLFMVSIGFGGTYLIVVGLKPIAAEFGWPREVPSLAYSLTMLGAGLGGVGMGWLADRWGIFWPALIGSVMIGLGILLSSRAESQFALFFAHGVVMGLLGNATLFSPLLTNATRWFDRRRGVAISVVASGQAVAGAVWPPVFSWAMEQYGWRDTMAFYSVFAVCMMVPVCFVFRRPPPGWAPAGSAAARAQIVHGPTRVLGLPPNLVLAMLCLAIVGCCVAMAMPMVHVVAHCSDLGYAPARGAEMLSLLLAAAFFSRLFWGRLSDRIGGLNTILLGSSCQLLGLVAFSWVESLAGLYVVALAYGLGYGGIVPSYALAIRELFPAHEAGWRIGAIFLFGTAGMALGGWLGGAIYDLAAAYRWAFLVGIAFNLLNLALIGPLVWWRDGVPAGRPALAT